MSFIKARVGDECKNMKIDDGGSGSPWDKMECKQIPRLLAPGSYITLKQQGAFDQLSAMNFWALNSSLNPL